jgi:hypothetical protein
MDMRKTHEQRASCQLRSKHFEHLEETGVGEKLNIDMSTEDTHRIVTQSLCNYPWSREM